ncbi:MAG TPA: hypothetical protein DCL61_23710 [Cyanobacteria bacterium UBA12227]|nr:hypothetical protein [Cyanobacteria bacterium UBA12227]HAX86718.1 hypothetical protein [Cyanobacteria bacterium UBA11370]HBY75797.1 hypothetical protein [Cyanobacteria bacterium UBA11148]
MKIHHSFYFLVSLFLVVAISLSNLPSIAQQVTRATIIEILDSDQVFIQNTKAKKNDVAQLEQQVRTAQARAGLQFNNNAAIRLGRNSSVIVGSQCVQLRGGQAVIAGGVRGCIGSVIAITRGTIYTLEVDDQGEGKIQVLEGEVEISDLENPDFQLLRLSAGQRVVISPSGQVGAITPMSEAEVEATLTGQLFQGFEIPIPGNDQLPDVRESNAQEGFTEAFLSEAVGGMSDPLSGSGVRSSLSSNTSGSEVRSSLSSNTIGEPTPALANSTSINGTFTVIKFGGSEANGTFTDSNGNATNIRVVRTSSQTRIQVSPTITIGGTTLGIDTPATTPLINGVPARDFSFGLSGNDAVVTVVGRDGQIFRARAIGIGGKEPNAGDTFRGVLSIGNAPDR